MEHNKKIWKLFSNEDLEGRFLEAGVDRHHTCVDWHSYRCQGNSRFLPSLWGVL